MCSCRFVSKTALIFSLLFITNCGVQKNPDSHSTLETESAISRSEKLSKLDNICRGLPVFEDVEPEVKSVNRKLDTLFYYYELKIDKEELKRRIKEHLIQGGWLLKVEGQGSFEYQSEFEKDKLWVQISYNEFSRLNYSVNCKDFSISR